MKRILFLVVISLFTFSLESKIFAEMKSHPVIKPVPGSAAKHKGWIKDPHTYIFNYIQDNKRVKKKVEGRHWTNTYYYFQENGEIDRSVTALEIIKNFKQAVIKQNGEIISETKIELIFTVPMPDGKTAWARVYCNGWKGYYQLDIVDEEAEGKADLSKTETKEQSQHDISQTAAMKQSPESETASFPSILKEAEELYLGGKKFEAVIKAKQAVLNIWNEIPLTIKNVRIVKDNKTYVTRQNNTFGSGEKIYIAAEIFGYAFKQVGAAYSIDISTDVYFIQGGDVLAGQQNFGKFELITPMPSTEFRLDLTYWLTDAPAGVYDVQTVVHDNNSGQSTKFTTQIKMK